MEIKGVENGFTARLLRRHRLWWELGPGWWKPGRIASLLHRVRQHYVLLSRTDPDARWQRGIYWQRALSNKWNAREFALRHGCRVPGLYWKGHRLSGLDFSALPEHFVLRPVMGHSRRGVYVFAGGLDLLRGRHFAEKKVKQNLRRDLRRYGYVPLMAEEFLKSRDDGYCLPVEYGFHTFAGHVGSVVVKRRVDAKESRIRHYTPEWNPFPPGKMSRATPDEELPPPWCFNEMLDAARTLGRFYGTYVRVDLYASDRGCVFGEFASVPTRGLSFTSFADEYLGNLWDEHCPDSV